MFALRAARSAGGKMLFFNIVAFGAFIVVVIDVFGRSWAGL